MAINLWELGGAVLKHDVLPYGLTPGLTGVGITTGEFILRFKAMAFQNVGTARLLMIDSGGLAIQEYIKPTNILTQYERIIDRRNLSGSNNIYIHDPDGSKSILVKDIELVERPIGKATINGVDGFQSGKWAFPAGTKVIDDETLEMTITTSYQRSTIDIPVLPSTEYSISVDKTGITEPSFVVRAYHSNGNVLVNPVVDYLPGFKTYTFKTWPDAVRIRIEFGSNANITAGEKMIFKRPMLNLGNFSAPYEKKRGERMVIPIEVSKNIFSVSHLVSQLWTQASINAMFKEYTLKPNTSYTLSSNVPVTATANLYFNGTGTAGYGVMNGTSRTFTTGATGKLYVAIPNTPYREYTAGLLDGTYWIQLEEGEAATVYESYKVARNNIFSNGIPKKNMFDGYVPGYLTSTNLQEAPTAPTVGQRTSNWMPCEPNTQYTVSGNNRSSWHFKNAAGTIVSGATTDTITTPSDAVMMRVYYSSDGSHKLPQIEKGLVATAYEPTKWRLRKIPNANIDKAPKGGVNKFPWGLLLNVYQPRKLITCEVDATESGQIEVILAPTSGNKINETGTRLATMYSKTFNLSVGVNVLEFNWDIPVGQFGIGLLSDSHPALRRDDTPGQVFPAKNNDESIEVLGGLNFASPSYSAPNANWYFFFNMKFTGKKNLLANKGLEFDEKIGQYINCGSVDLRDSKIEVEFKCKLNRAIAGTHAIVALNTYSVGILVNQIGTSLLLYVGHSAACANLQNFFEVGKDVHVKVIFDKINNTVAVYKNGVLFPGILYPQYTNYPGIIVQNMYIAGHPSSYNSPDVVMKYTQVKKNDEVLFEYDFTNPRSIIGNKVKAKKGVDGTIIGYPIQLNQQPKR